MKLLSVANRAPAMPARNADAMNATVRTTTTFKPIDWLAISASRVAHMARPHLLFLNCANSISSTVISAIAITAMPNSFSVCPKNPGRGMFITPFQPPVKSFISAALCSITKPKAIVTMAR